MSDRLNSPPVFLLAFANDRNDRAQYLRNLPDELRQIREALDQAKSQGLCDYVYLPDATLKEILDTFTKNEYRNRIAVFHYGGHANSFQLMLETNDGRVATADAGGLAAFLSQQRGLQLVFLNGCSTQQQVEALLDANISMVIATSQAIKDEVATEFASRFYRGLAGGITVHAAYKEAEGAARTQGNGNVRNLFWAGAQPSLDKIQGERWPWDLYFKEGAENEGHWNLPETIGNPLFGVPPVPPGDLPNEPFRHLAWFTREDAEIFFGRNYQIRQLYDRITEPSGAPIVLLYGQTGVGKSSLLDAGLTPRMESTHDILYLRRNQELGLLETAKHGIGLCNEENNSLSSAWRAREAQTGKPLALIVDQVEEVFTRPTLDSKDELEDFLEALQEAFSKPQERPRGKLILGFRKEWESEIEQQLRAYKLPHAKVFLQPLDRQGIIQAVTGVTNSPRLKRHFGLVIEEGLAEVISDDLSADADSPLAPTLQILLTKMWAEAKGRSNANPLFERALYEELKRQGVLLGDFLDQQLAKLEAARSDLVVSGLALDVLGFHTTQLGTAEQRTAKEIEQEYRHCKEAVTFLVQKLKDLYLLAELPDDDRNAIAANSTRLAHDTLAPLVRARLDNSVSDGQRARRILENRSQEWRNNEHGAPLDGHDLTVVEQGAAGMRAWTSDEERLIQVSRKKRDQSQLRNRLLRVAGVTAIVLILIGAGVVWWQYRQAKASERRSISRQLAMSATSQLQTDPELSLLLAMQAMNQADTSEAQDALRRALVESHLRTTLRGHKSEIHSARFSPDARLVVTASKDQTARVWETNTGKTVADLKGHTGLIFSAEFSRDGSLLVTASEDGTAKLWQTSTWTSVRELRGKSGRVLGATFSPDGNFVITTDSEATARVWDTHNGNSVKVLSLPSSVGGAEFSSDGKMLATFGDVVTVWDTSTWRQLAEFHGPTDKGSEENGSFSPDGKYIVSAQGNRGDHIARIWEISTKRIVGELKGHTGEIFTTRFSPDGKFIVTASGDKSARVWETQTWQNVGALLGHSDLVFDAEFSRDSRLIVTASKDATARVWSNTMGELQTDLRGHTAVVNSAAFSPDGKLIVTASDDKTARVWKADMGGLVAELKGHTDKVVSAELSRDGGLIVTASNDRTARVWQTSTGKSLAELTGHSGVVRRAVFSPDSKLVVTASADSTARVWEASSGKNVATLKHPSMDPNDPSEVHSAVFSPDGKFIVTTSEFSAWVWNTGSGELISQLTPSAHATEGGGGVTIAEFSPDSKQIVIADEVGNVEIRGIKAESTAILLKGHTQYITKVAFSPDGKFIITASGDATTRVWEVNTGKTVLVLQGAGSEVFDAEFSPNGKFIVTGDQDNTARIWDAQTGRLLTELKGNKSAIRKVKHSPDGKFILTLSQDDRVRIYLCEVCESSENLLALASTRVTRPLTPDESRTYLP